jgi:uncharacterized protein YqeY
VTVLDRVKSDLTAAMKAGERDRVGALRMVLSELQKAHKDGGDDDLAVLRRERKRRLESARAYRDGGREELAAPEESEAALIESYLPAELGDDELERLIADAVAEVEPDGPRDMGRVMKAAMARVDGRADGRRVSDKVKAALGA